MADVQPKQRRMKNCLRSRCAATMVGMLILLTGSPALAQRANEERVIAKARRTFKVYIEALEELAQVRETPADSNGQVRAWDRKWKRTLEKLKRRSKSWGSLVEDGCADSEVDALSEYVHLVISSARDAFFNSYSSPSAAQASAGRELAIRRVIADEAARRRAEGLSCEDLPFRYVVAAPSFPEPLRELLDSTDSNSDLEAVLKIAKEGYGPGIAPRPKEDPQEEQQPSEVQKATDALPAFAAYIDAMAAVADSEELPADVGRRLRTWVEKARSLEEEARGLLVEVKTGTAQSQEDRSEDEAAR